MVVIHSPCCVGCYCWFADVSRHHVGLIFKVQAIQDPTGYSETSVRNNHSTACGIPVDKTSTVISVYGINYTVVINEAYLLSGIAKYLVLQGVHFIVWPKHRSSCTHSMKHSFS
jgi:hypothetical protein